MKGIVFHKEVYIYIDDKSVELPESMAGEIILREKERDYNLSDIIAGNYKYYPDRKHLFGGRVELYFHDRSYYDITIDGITIKKIQCYRGEEVYFFDSFSGSEICSFLNQMENLGVDSFLENYKKELLQAKSDYDEMARRMEAVLSMDPDNSDLKESILSIHKFLCMVICIVFLLGINKNAGLDNHLYSESYSEIISLSTI